MGQLALQRYQLREVLGHGGTGIVYEAYDPQTEALVALKTIASPAGESLYRLKQEFRSLSDVQHPNLVRLGELSSDEGQWYFTMELVRGSSFIDYVRPGAPLADGVVSGVRPAARPATPDAPTAEDTSSLASDGVGARAARPLDEARLRAALAQLVSALCAIHEAGHVHRDVKPSNVLVSSEGRLVLLDFGLVAALKTLGRSDWGMLGTPAFMAPEQIEGTDVGAAADWYAMGVMLFFALTGSLPFTGGSGKILEAKLMREAPSPRSLVASVPADLDALCTGLLRREPSERPTSDDIQRALGMSGDRLASGQMRAAEPAAVFVGREREMLRLQGALADVRVGRGRLVIIEGEPGVGKSAVAHRFLEAVGASATVLSGRCYEQETVPFKGVDTILDALSEHLLQLRDVEVAAVLEGGVRYLAAVFPVLNRVPAIAAATLHVRGVDNAAALREQAFGEFERLVHALAERSPLVLLLDDLQWADRDSLALLHRTLVGAGAAPCLFLATMRSGAEVPSEALALAAAAERIVLGGLSQTESAALWDALWPTHTSRATAPDAREAVMRDAVGHPLFLTELVRAARAGHLDRHTGAGLEEVLWERVCERDETDRRFLEMTALAGAPTPFDVLARAAKIDLGESLTRLGPLRAAQLIRVSRRGEERLVEPYHDRVRESTLRHMEREPGATMADRHRRLGRALLEGASEATIALRVYAIVQHLNAARDVMDDPAERARLAGLNLLAARQARLATAYDKAASHSRIGLELLGERGWSDAYALTRDLHVERTNAEFLAGNDAAALACFEAARARLTSVEDRTDLHVTWIGLQTGRGRFPQALASGRAALAEVGARLPSRGSLLSVLAQYALNRLSQRGRRADELLHLPQLTDGVPQSVQKLLVSLAPPAFFSDTNLLTWILLRTADLSMRHGVSNVSSYGFSGYGLALSGAFGKHEEGASFGRLALALHERFQSHALGAKLHLLSGFLASWVGPFSDGKELLRKGQQLAMSLGDTGYECYTATVLSVLTFCESADLASVQTVAESAKEVSVRRMDRDMAGVPDAHARYAAALRGLTPSVRDLGTAASSDEAFRESLSDASTPTAVFYYFFCNAELRYHFGDIDGAHALLALAKKRTQGIFALPTTLELCFLDALVMARRHERAGFFGRIALRARVAQSARKLRAWARSSPANFEAHALIVEAELARIRGRAGRARELFERAITAARAHKSTKREAMALELSAAHERAATDTAAAERRGKEAVDAYRRWGAVAKAEDLERRLGLAGSVAAPVAEQDRPR